MLHLIYILAFTVLALLAVANLIRNLMMLGADAQRTYAPRANPYTQRNGMFAVPHPELLDESGNIVNEPFLVMRSISMEDAREQLDALYNASAYPSDEAHDEA
jgi:hypothetical protein